MRDVADACKGGDVYTWGGASRGQLGHGSTTNQQTPKMVAALKRKNIRSVACGPFHTIAITGTNLLLYVMWMDGRSIIILRLLVDLCNVYSWGQGKHMRLGHGTDKDEFIPRIVEVLMNKVSFL